MQTDKERSNMMELSIYIDEACSRILNILELFQHTYGRPQSRELQ